MIQKIFILAKQEILLNLNIVETTQINIKNKIIS